MVPGTQSSSDAEGGFSQSAIDAAKAYRVVFETMARPGTMYRLHGAMPPAPMSAVAGISVLTPCDSETLIHLRERWTVRRSAIGSPFLPLYLL